MYVVQISSLPLSEYSPPTPPQKKKPCSSQDYFLSLSGCYGMSLLRQRYFKCKIVRMLNGIKCPKFRDGKNFPHHSAFSHMGFSFPKCVIVCVCIKEYFFIHNLFIIYLFCTYSITIPQNTPFLSFSTA